jgi:hypothetical protein
VDMESDSGDDEEDNDDVDDDEEEDEEEGNKDEDDGKEPWMICQGEMVNTSADDVDTMVDDQPIMLPEQGLEIHQHTPRPDPTGKNDLTRPVTHREAVFGLVIHSIFDAWHYEVLWTCELTRLL